MGRNELEDQSPDEEAKDSNRSSGSRISPDGRGKDGGKGQAKGAAQGDRPPPWTKYLLEEGLDRTKAFSRYRGMFAGETFIEMHEYALRDGVWMWFCYNCLWAEHTLLTAVVLLHFVRDDSSSSCVEELIPPCSRRAFTAQGWCLLN